MYGRVKSDSRAARDRRGNSFSVYRNYRLWVKVFAGERYRRCRKSVVYLRCYRGYDGGITRKFYGLHRVLGVGSDFTVNIGVCNGDLRTLIGAGRGGRLCFDIAGKIERSRRKLWEIPVQATAVNARSGNIIVGGAFNILKLGHDFKFHIYVGGYPIADS